MATTTQDMINSIKRKGSFPTASDLFSNSDYLSILNDEMRDVVVPLLNSINEEFFLDNKDHSVTAGQSAYRIPKRAIGSSLRDVQLIDSSGGVQGLTRLFEDDRVSTTSDRVGYYLKGNQVILSPTPAFTTGTLRLNYFRRPQEFVLPAACALVTGINTLTNTVTVASAPSTFTTGVLIDFAQGDTPYDTLAIDQAITGISGTSITFASLPADLALGDYLSLAGQACVPGVPEELVPLLVQAALATCLSSKKDSAAKDEGQKRDKMAKSLVDLLSPRVKSNDVKINNRNGLLGRFQRY